MSKKNEEQKQKNADCASMSEIKRRALENNLTYGQYMAVEYAKDTKIEFPKWVMKTKRKAVS